MLIETLITYIHNKYYTPEIQKLEFHFPPVRILGTRRCFKELRKGLKLQRKQHDVLFRSDYTEWIVSSFLIKCNLSTMIKIVMYPLKEFH